MTLVGLFVRFIGIYLALVLGLTAIFGVLGLKAETSVSIAALSGAVVGACLSFAKKNQRYLEASEKTRAILGMWAIDVGLQIVMAFAVVGKQLMSGVMVFDTGPMP